MTVYQQISANKRRTFLLISVFVLLVAAVAWAVAYVYDGGPGGFFIAGVVAITSALFSYYGGDKVALLTAGARGPLAKEDNPYIMRMVENLCITAGLPMPKVYIIEDNVPNAFATGRDPQHASIALTTGIINSLENEELEGVIAHELSHIQNYDIRVMTIVIICVGIISLLADWFFRISFFGGRDSDSKNSGIQIVLMVVGVVLIILSPIIAKLIQMAVSRKREYLADASGALLTRYPEGLAKALEKIDAHAAPMRNANSATSHLFISNPFGKNSSWRNLFSTHPPIEERVKALRSMA